MATQIAAVSARVGTHGDGSSACVECARAAGPLACFESRWRSTGAGWGWMLGRTFLMLVHIGRTTGRPHQAVAMVLV